jgi:hypothetical protein
MQLPGDGQMLWTMCVCAGALRYGMDGYRWSTALYRAADPPVAVSRYAMPWSANLKRHETVIAQQY